MLSSHIFSRPFRLGGGLVAGVWLGSSLLAAQPVAAELVGFYPFEGNAEDVSGNERHGQVNGAALVSNGYEGQAYQFNGEDSYIELPIDINPSAMPRLTMGAWVNAEVADGIRAVLSHDDGGFDRNLNIDFRGEGTNDHRYSAFAGEDTGVVAAGPDPAPTGEWVFVAVRYDAPAGRVTLDVGSQRTLVTGNPGSGLSTMRVGSNPSFDEFFQGRIDNVFIFSEVLSDDAIDAIREEGSLAILPPES